MFLWQHTILGRVAQQRLDLTHNMGPRPQAFEADMIDNDKALQPDIRPVSFGPLGRRYVE